MGNEQSTEAAAAKSQRYTKVERLHEKVETLLRFDSELNKEVDAIFRDSGNGAADAVSAARARMPSGESERWCLECGEEIPEKRRTALPGVKRCVECQSGQDASARSSGFSSACSRCSSWIFGFAEPSFKLSSMPSTAFRTEVFGGLFTSNVTASSSSSFSGPLLLAL